MKKFLEKVWALYWAYGIAMIVYTLVSFTEYISWENWWGRNEVWNYAIPGIICIASATALYRLVTKNEDVFN